MKKVKKWKLIILCTLTLSLVFLGCNENENQLKTEEISNESLELEFNLDVDLSKGIFNLDKGMNTFSNELFTYLDSDHDVNEFNFNFVRIEDKLYINYTNKELKKIVGDKALRSNTYFGAPCKTQKKT